MFAKTDSVKLQVYEMLS